MNIDNLQGVICPVVTPVRKGRFDAKAFDKHLRFLIKEGVDSLFILGSTGEGPCVPDEMKKEIVRKASGIAGTAVPLLVGAIETSLVRTCRLIEMLDTPEVDAFVVTPPCYFPNMSSRDIELFYTNVAKASPKPIIIYHNPATTKQNITLASLTELSAQPNIIAVKLTTNDFAFIEKVIFALAGKSFKVFVGSEEFLFAGLAMGAHGVIASTANYFPKLTGALVASAGAHNRRKAITLQLLILNIYKMYDQCGWLKACKYFTHLAVNAVSPEALALQAELEDVYKRKVEKMFRKISDKLLAM